MNPNQPQAKLENLILSDASIEWLDFYHGEFKLILPLNISHLDYLETLKDKLISVNLYTAEIFFPECIIKNIETDHLKIVLTMAENIVDDLTYKYAIDSLD